MTVASTQPAAGSRQLAVNDNVREAADLAAYLPQAGFAIHERPASVTRALKPVIVSTDGACSGNPGPGGYGVVLRYGDHRRELSGGFRRTTNNRMELMAAIKALEALREPCDVTLLTDSEYLVNGLEKGWAKRWRSRGWRRPGRKIAPNWELWQRLLELGEYHRVKVRWVEGHAGHLDNERCDELATSALTRQDLAIDAGYERPPVPDPT